MINPPNGEEVDTGNYDLIPFSLEQMHAFIVRIKFESLKVIKTMECIVEKISKAIRNEMNLGK